MTHWKSKSVLGLLLACMLLAGVASSAEAAPRKHVEVDLLAEKTAVVPGETITIAVRERIEPEWHTYWVNPGDSGEPSSIAWSLPQGFEAGPIQWPLPDVIPIPPLVDYGYSGELLLLTDIAVPKDIAGDSVTLAAKVNYLVCKDICVPEESEARLTLPVAAAGGGAPSDHAAAIAKARATVPVPLPGSAAYSVSAAKGELRLTVSADASILNGATDARFFPLGWGAVSNSAPQTMTLDGGKLTLDLKQGETKETPDRLEGVLALTKGGERKGYMIAATRGPDGAALGAPAKLAESGASGGGGIAAPVVEAPASASGAVVGNGPASDEGAVTSVGLAILFAFLGGAILNLMPCVFPVLAIKALGFAKKSDGGHVQQGFAYLGGVLVCFAALAALLAVLREGSAAFGWGFQFQSPAFVLALAILFFVMGLSLSGVVSFGGGLMATGDSLARKPGNAGYFFTGVLAAVAATPCTAPFMGAAIGYALTQPTAVLAAVMLGLGLGFAAPVMLLSLSPGLQRILPKPGAWMETLKQVLAFPLYATAAWLVWVLSIQTGSDGVMAAALAFVGVGFAAWLAGKTTYAPLRAKIIAPVLGIAAFAVSLSLAETAGSVNMATSAEKAALSGETFTKARLDGLIAEGKPVFVNLTAAWCITCKVNERVALKSDAVADAFAKRGITYLVGDWTSRNPEITDLLHTFGRAGVPLYLFYPGGGQEPRVLPQLLTVGLVLDETKTKAKLAGPSSNKGA
ncbi:thioredoxin family protein [Rhodomicrobium vannielii ATCC 17100]|uniref:protein-disulfide reductase DsbD family protein n=1 Tax=Rhodomicrobium vannielii TaxID=1069 RepID=UPI00191AD477|nr:protein-disulfide reductase DsbD domain-containing protein [Rhodomicrobium vannielii]MBJ7535633.1 thioredoxin family protein [Rhodomicrobium vannielii ATCC 17100]